MFGSHDNNEITELEARLSSNDSENRIAELKILDAHVHL